jgi:hypothetical protein
VPAVLDLIEHGLLDHTPPRRLPPLFLPNLLGEYLLERPLRSYVDPIVIGTIVAAVAMVVMGIGSWLWIVLLAIVALRIVNISWDVGRRAWHDYRLVRYGIIVPAHIMGMRIARDASGTINGAYLDCVIPTGKRRTSVGSVWLPDADQATALSREGRVLVIALERAPGTWRLRELDNPALRYEPIEV